MAVSCLESNSSTSIMKYLQSIKSTCWVHCSFCDHFEYSNYHNHINSKKHKVKCVSKSDFNFHECTVCNGSLFAPHARLYFLSDWHEKLHSDLKIDGGSLKIETRSKLLLENRSLDVDNYELEDVSNVYNNIFQSDIFSCELSAGERKKYIISKKVCPLDKRDSLVKEGKLVDRMKHFFFSYLSVLAQGKKNESLQFHCFLCSFDGCFMNKSFINHLLSSNHQRNMFIIEDHNVNVDFLVCSNCTETKIYIGIEGDFQIHASKHNGPQWDPWNCFLYDDRLIPFSYSAILVSQAIFPESFSSIGKGSLPVARICTMKRHMIQVEKGNSLVYLKPSYLEKGTSEQLENNLSDFLLEITNLCKTPPSLLCLLCHKTGPCDFLSILDESIQHFSLNFDDSKMIILFCQVCSLIYLGGISDGIAHYNYHIKYGKYNRHKDYQKLFACMHAEARIVNNSPLTPKSAEKGNDIEVTKAKKSVVPTLKTQVVPNPATVESSKSKVNNSVKNHLSTNSDVQPTIKGCSVVRPVSVTEEVALRRIGVMKRAAFLFNEPIASSYLPQAGKGIWNKKKENFVNCYLMPLLKPICQITKFEKFHCMFCSKEYPFSDGIMIEHFTTSSHWNNVYDHLENMNCVVCCTCRDVIICSKSYVKKFCKGHIPHRLLDPKQLPSSNGLEKSSNGINNLASISPHSELSVSQFSSTSSIPSKVLSENNYFLSESKAILNIFSMKKASFLCGKGIKWTYLPPLEDSQFHSLEEFLNIYFKQLMKEVNISIDSFRMLNCMFCAKVCMFSTDNVIRHFRKASHWDNINSIPHETVFCVVCCNCKDVIICSDSIVNQFKISKGHPPHLLSSENDGHPVKEKRVASLKTLMSEVADSLQLLDTSSDKVETSSTSSFIGSLSQTSSASELSKKDSIKTPESDVAQSLGKLNLGGKGLVSHNVTSKNDALKLKNEKDLSHPLLLAFYCTPIVRFSGDDLHFLKECPSSALQRRKKFVFEAIACFFNTPADSISFFCWPCKKNLVLTEELIKTHFTSKKHQIASDEHCCSDTVDSLILLCKVCFEVKFVPRHVGLVHAGNHSGQSMPPLSSPENESRILAVKASYNHLYSMAFYKVDDRNQLIVEKSTLAVRKSTKEPTFVSQNYFFGVIGNYFDWSGDTSLYCFVCQKKCRFVKEVLICDVSSQKHLAGSKEVSGMLGLLLCKKCKTVHIGTQDNFLQHLENHNSITDEDPLQNSGNEQSIKEKIPGNGELEKGLVNELSNGIEIAETEMPSPFSVLKNFEILGIKNSTETVFGRIPNIFNEVSMISSDDDKLDEWLIQWNPGVLGYTCALCPSEVMEFNDWLMHIFAHYKEMGEEFFGVVSCAQCRCISLETLEKLPDLMHHQVHNYPVPKHSPLDLLLQYIRDRYSSEPFCFTCGSAYFCFFCNKSFSHRPYWVRHFKTKRHKTAVTLLCEGPPLIESCQECGLIYCANQISERFLDSSFHAEVDKEIGKTFNGSSCDPSRNRYLPLWNEESEDISFVGNNACRLRANCEADVEHLLKININYLLSIDHSFCLKDCQFSVDKRALMMCYSNPFIIYNASLSHLCKELNAYCRNSNIIKISDVNYCCLLCKSQCCSQYKGPFSDIMDHFVSPSHMVRSAPNLPVRSLAFMCTICLTLFFANSAEAMSYIEESQKCNHEKLFQLITDYISNIVYVKGTKALVNSIKEYIPSSPLKPFYLKSKIKYVCDMCKEKYTSIELLSQHLLAPCHILRNAGAIIVICFNCGELILISGKKHPKKMCSHLNRWINQFFLKSLPVSPGIAVGSMDGQLARCTIITSYGKLFILAFTIPLEDPAFWTRSLIAVCCKSIKAVFDVMQLNEDLLFNTTIFCQPCQTRFKPGVKNSIAEVEEHCNTDLHVSIMSMMTILPSTKLPLVIFCHDCNELSIHGSMSNIEEHFRSPRHRANYEKKMFPTTSPLADSPIYEVSQLSRESMSLFQSRENLMGSILSYCEEIKKQSNNFNVTKHKLKKDLEASIRVRFPDANCYFFGSREAGLCDSDSDVDIYINLSGNYTEQIDGKEPIVALKELLKYNKRNFECTQIIFSCRVPLWRGIHKPSKLNIDINCVNASGAENTKLVKLFLSMDERVFHLAVAIRLWATANNIRLTRGINSYTCSWLVFFYLMQPGIRILPPVRYLYTLERSEPLLIAGWDLGFCRDLDLVKRCWSEHNLSNDHECKLNLMDLLKGFFKFYSELDFKPVILDPWTGGIWQRETLVLDVSRSLSELDIEEDVILLDPVTHDCNILRNSRGSFIEHFKILCHKTLLTSCSFL